MKETTYVVHWEGPFEWGEIEKHQVDEQVLYALYGSHHLYGRDVLLYIGRTSAGISNRLRGHEKWVADEYDVIRVRLASVGLCNDWKDWEDGERYPKASSEVVTGVEALLIHAHQPAYNSQNSASLNQADGFRVFNTGRLGHLLPELSFRYYEE